MLEQIVALVASLVGLGAVIALIINTLKFFGVVKEGDAQTWSVGINLVVVLIVYALKLFKPDFDVITIDPILQEVAAVGTFIMTFLMQVLSSKLTHFAVKGVPVVGKSYSLGREEKEQAQEDYLD